jgi:hypothetical protein
MQRLLAQPQRLEAEALAAPRGPRMHRKHSSNGRRVRSTGGILAVCIGKFRKFFRANRLGLFQKPKEK